MAFNKFRLIILFLFLSSCKKDFIALESSKVEFDDFSVVEIVISTYQQGNFNIKMIIN